MDFHLNYTKQKLSLSLSLSSSIMIEMIYMTVCDVEATLKCRNDRTARILIDFSFVLMHTSSVSVLLLLSVDDAAAESWPERWESADKQRETSAR